MMISEIKKIIQNFKRIGNKFQDLFFEKYYSLDLGGVIKNQDLIELPQNSKNHATAYQAVWNSSIRELLLQAEKTMYKFENFIDIGSGKGKACFYVYIKKGHQFKNITGIEFSRSLIEIANLNNKKIKSKKIRFIEMDASNYIIPTENNLIFLFNPFDEIIFDLFIRNNLENFKNHNSIIAYANDVSSSLLIKYGFRIIYKNNKRNISLYEIYS